MCVQYKLAEVCESDRTIINYIIKEHPFVKWKLL